ncbi:MAG: hypothetical protein VKJ06_04850 [Vampirovibrionales bacterium]|nr:hypothetical protein [Vampirovibrionales bacterium]
MKKWILIISLVLFASLAGLGYLLNNFVQEGNRLDKESKAYAQEVYPKLVTACDSVDANSLMAQKALSVTSTKSLRLFCKKVNQVLGSFQEIESVDGETHISFGSKSGTTAQYIFLAKHQKGSANVTLTLMLENEQWKVLGFNVNSEKFLE